MDEWLRTRLFGGRASSVGSVIRALSRLHNQHSKPSCVGQAHSSGIEPIVGYDVSSVNLWEPGRILQGDGKDAEAGTRSEYVIRWMEEHGWCNYESGEDTRATKFDTDSRIGKTLAEAIRAHSRRDRVVRVKTIDPRQSEEELVRQIVAALLEPDCYIPWGGGCTERYFDPPDDVVLGPEYRSGDDNGHCELIFGWNQARGAFANKGSWGDWTWCTLPSGERAIGCNYLAPSVLRKAREIDVVRVIR